MITKMMRSTNILVLVAMMAAFLALVVNAYDIDHNSNNNDGSSDDTYSSDGPAYGSNYFSAPHIRRKKHRMQAQADEADEVIDVVCLVHGNILDTGVSRQCICQQDPQKGFWAGTNCNECDKGWAGPSCTLECNGGSCTPCSGHGRCKEGVGGDGTCECDTDNTKGHWAGDDCNRCENKYFGAECLLSCPGLDATGRECNGRGNCITTAEGLGACRCNEGWDADSGCDTCDGSHFGSGCTSICAGTVTIGLDEVPCSGHGKCFNGTAGNGTCLCDPFYGLADCSKKCPDACSGNGVCDEGATGKATCACSDNWAPPNCGVCIPSKTGVNCTIDCPTNSSTGRICSDAGVCSYRSDTGDSTDAYCECVDGYLGTVCESYCPGSPPCSGHGKCIENPANGVKTCQCHADATNGYWDGDLCDRCALTYNNSEGCKQPCPLEAGVVCSGHGQCAEGQCYCDRNDPLTSRDYCNFPTQNQYACQVSSIYVSIDPQSCDSCSCVYCGQLRHWGDRCGNECPGYNRDTETACNGHGYCREVKDSQAGTGACACEIGYSGSACQLACPTNPDNGLPCSGEAHGYCRYNAAPAESQETAFCQCNGFYKGPACEIGCPIVAGQVCSGHGNCLDDTAECECVGPWTGTSCSVPCACNTDNGRCNLGICRDYLSSQTCEFCVCNGNFTGKCDECKPGFQGQLCEGECIKGVTVETSCQCQTNYSLPSCSKKCAADSNGIVCGGHGECQWGALKQGLCSCETNWYGDACTKFCVASSQCTQLRNPQCNRDTGDCECLDDGSLGRWAWGPNDLCDVCKVGSWGSECKEQCECNDNGSCDQSTGECSCYNNAQQGFWTGSNCDTCIDGYIGQFCERIEVQLSQIKRKSTTATDFVIQGVASYSDRQGLTIGAQPTFAMDVSKTDSVDVRNSTNEEGTANLFFKSYVDTDLGLNFTYDCTPNGTGHIKPDIAFSVSSTIETYYFLQPQCGLPFRYVVWTFKDGTNELDEAKMKTVYLANYQGKHADLNETLRVFAATAQIDTGEYDVIPPQFVVVFLAEPNPDIPGTYYPGGYLVRISLDEDDSNPDAIVKMFEKAPVSALFTVQDLALSKFVTKTEPQQIALSGQYQFKWDVWLVHLTTEGAALKFEAGLDFYPKTASFLDSRFTIRNKAQCWPEALETSTEPNCGICTKVGRVVFKNDGLVLALITETTGLAAYAQSITVLAWLEVLQRLPAGTKARAFNPQTDRCADVVTATTPLGAPSFIDAFGRETVLDNCALPTGPCRQAIYAARTSSTNFLEFVPSAIVYDPLPADILYLAIRHQDDDNDASYMVKFDMSSDGFGMYGNSALVRPVYDMTIANRQRMLYGVDRQGIVSFLLYEVRELSPDIADTRGGTNVTLIGSGFVATDDGTMTCGFVDPVSGNTSFVAADTFNFTHVTCKAPTQIVDASDSSSCEGQQVEASIFGNYWLTANQRSVQRVQRPFLNPEAQPDRGFKDRAQQVNVTGNGFVPSKYSKCRFYSMSEKNKEVLESEVVYISPTKVQCTQDRATLPSSGLSYVDISLDGQLWSVETPPQYIIVGDPTGIQMQKPTQLKRATQTLNLTFQAWIMDSELHRLEALDEVARLVRVYANVTMLTQCKEGDFSSWRREDDGYPWDENFGHCRPMRLNSTTWEMFEAVERVTDPPTATPAPSGSNGPGSRRFEELQAKKESEFDRFTEDYKGATRFVKRSVPGAGDALFDEFYIWEPRVGRIEFTLAGQAPSWMANVVMTIEPGDPYALRIFNLNDFDDASKFVVVDGTPLTPMELIIIDALANIVQEGTRDFQVTLTAKVQADFQQEEGGEQENPNPKVVMDGVDAPASLAKYESNRILFNDVFLPYRHERSYYLLLTSQPVLVPVESPRIRTLPCTEDEYKYNLVQKTGIIIGECRPCPPVGATCDGTENVKVDPGYWRAEGTTIDIYECKGGAEVCPGSEEAAKVAKQLYEAEIEANNGTVETIYYAANYSCKDGHRGPMCTLCKPGWGKSGATSCTECEDEGTTTAYVVLIALAMFTGVLGWIVMTLRKDEVTDVSIIARTVVNHAQAAGELGEFSSQWSPFLTSLFNVQGGASSFSLSGVQAVDCMVKQSDSDYTSIFAAYMCLPPIAVGLGLFVFVVVRVARLKPVITKKLRQEIMADIEMLGERAQTAIILERYPLYMVIITSLCVTMFTLYQTLITQSTLVLKCKTVVTDYIPNTDGPATPVENSYLEADMAFSCDSAAYLSLKQAAWIFTALYGFGIPFMFVMGYKLVNARINKPELTKLMFTFLIGGYKDQFWWWQAIIMIRKMVLVCCIAFLRANRVLQSYCAMWTMSAALVLQIWFNPNEKDEHNLCEALSLAIITLTLNLSLLYFWPDLPPFGKWVLTGCLILMTMGAFMMFGYFLWPPFKKGVLEGLEGVKAKLKALKEGDEEEEEEENDNRLTIPGLHTRDDDSEDEFFEELRQAGRTGNSGPRFKSSNRLRIEASFDEIETGLGGSASGASTAPKASSSAPKEPIKEGGHGTRASAAGIFDPPRRTPKAFYDEDL